VHNGVTAHDIVAERTLAGLGQGVGALGLGRGAPQGVGQGVARDMGLDAAQRFRQDTFSGQH